MHVRVYQIAHRLVGGPFDRGNQRVGFNDAAATVDNRGGVCPDDDAKIAYGAFIGLGHQFMDARKIEYAICDFDERQFFCDSRPPAPARQHRRACGAPDKLSPVNSGRHGASNSWQVQALARLETFAETNPSSHRISHDIE